jgi:hypothetical protein
MKLRRIVAAFVGVFLVAAPVVGARGNCETASVAVASPQPVHHQHSDAAGHDDRGQKHSSGPCQSHESECCGIAGACANLTFAAEQSIGARLAYPLPAIVIAKQFAISAPLRIPEPPPPRA